ncbi:hypothetical protein AAFF_G00183490 [Aldrovandia affinis]|uniref:Uncharacterized protein n=1 Tax=Aldrovandia affinis TaxID=143900 RepID=A0AAD7RJW7_9TELE|nr:hypothetical protein AAFF_G00183490 [Aldrovandia affinis]
MKLNDLSPRQRKGHSREKTRADTSMLFILGITLCLLFVIVCVSNRLKQRKNAVTIGRHGKLGYPNSPKPHAKGKKKGMGENDLKFLATILSAGLVDADPTTLKHLREYRDLRGGKT